MAEEFDKRAEADLTPLSEESTAQGIGPAEGENFRQDAQETRGPGTELFEWVQMVMGCVLVAVILFNCFARLTRVDGHSMDNTLQDGELMLVWSVWYQPKQGDIVVVNKKSVTFLSDRAIVKRVIATGGQTVDVDYDAGLVYVDGQPLDEPYIKEPMYNTGSPTMQQTHWEVPEGSVFVMGDNRNNSTDSRDDRLGTVDEDYILGEVVLALWPLSKFGPM